MFNSKIKISITICCIFALQIIYSVSANSQCVHSIYPISASIPALGGSDDIFLTTEECELYDAYTYDEWYYMWVDYYEEIVTVYADPNHEGYRQGTLIIDNYNSESDFEVPVSQEYGCEQLPSPGVITGPGTVCAGGSANYSISPVEGATLYSWKVDGISDNEYDTVATLLFPTYGSTVTVTAAGYNECGEGIQSSKQVTLHYAPAPGTISGNQTISFNDTASVLNSTVDASDFLGQSYYQWQSSFSGTGNWINIEGATNSTYSPGVLQSTIHYRRAVTDNCGTAYSNIVKITVTFPEVTYLSVEELPDPETRTLNTSYLVGTTSGNISVDPLGAATFTIPIELLPGVNGLTPDISLIYSSNSNSGIAGYGWDVRGLSAISRGPQTIYHDDVSKGVSMSSDDRYYLDGQRLVNTTSTYGSANAQYQTENDIFTRVTPQSTDYNNGPAWFNAETKAGLFYEYGNSIDSKNILDGYPQILNWYVSKITDQFNNQITIKYIQDHSVIYPEEISYGPNKIVFSYKSRSDKNITYIKGASLEQWLLLDKITVSYNSAVVKSYEMKYSLQGAYNTKSILNEIIEYGSGTTRLNSTAISYQMDANVSMGQYVSNSSHEYITYKSNLIGGDFNGDGKTDFLCLPNDEAAWTGMKVYTSDGNGNFTFYFSETTSLNLETIIDIRSLDLNGDEKDDILYEEGTSGSSTFKYMLFDGSSFTEPQSIIVFDNSQSSGLTGKRKRTEDLQENDNELTAADYNGDGVNDIFLNDPNGYWYIKSFANSSGQLTSTLNSLASGYNSYVNGQVESGDFDGDGKADLWSIENNGFKIFAFNGSNIELLYSATWLTNKHFFSLGDFNADGKVDVFLYGTGNGETTEYDWSNWQIKHSTGTDFTSYSIPQKKSNLKDDIIRSGDLNGDGATDIIVPRDASGTYNYYFISNNSGTDFYTQSQVINSYSYHIYHLGDYDGDGHIDYLYVDRDPDPWWNGYQIWKTSGNTKTLMQKIGNGLGSLTSLTYTKLSQDDNYTKGSGALYPVLDFQGPLNVVASVQSDNGKGSLNTMSYNYEGAKIHLQGKGFLGYAKTRVTDVASGIDNINISDYNTTYFYPYFKKVISKLTGASTDTLTKTTNTWSQIVLDSTLKRIFPYVSGSTQLNFKTGQSVSVNTQYDSWGNPTSIVKSYLNGPTETTTNSFNNTTSATLWLLGRPDSTTIEFSDADTTITRVTERVFSTVNNSITSETMLPGNDKEITKFFSYNSNGTLKSDSTISGGKYRTKSITYESDGIRIHTSTDELSHVSTNTYDNNGRLSSSQDYLGNTVTYQYDGLGRQISVSSDDGSQVTATIAWENPASVPALARYSTLKTGNDGSQSKTWYDKLGREIRNDKKGFDGSIICTSTVYNTIGQIESYSDPYFSNDSPSWNTFTYDDYGIKTSLSRPSGRNTSWEYNSNTVTETTAGKSFSKTYSSDGTIASATDNGGTITYSYFPDGKVKTITAPGEITSGMEYDHAGNQTRLVDPSAGTISYTYDGFGNLTSQVSALSDTTTISYLSDGRISQKASTEGTTKYRYNAHKQLINIGSPDGVSRTFGYDTKGRVVSVTDTIPGSAPFSSSFTYDGYGRSASITHPSGVTETYSYNSNGYLTSISAGGSTRWTISGLNARQQITSGQYGSNLTAYHLYDDYGYPVMTNVGTIKNDSCSFNPVTGNLSWRRNNKYSNLREDFQYDNLDRLDNIYIGDTMTLDMSYNNYKAGISNKSDLGTLIYEAPDNPYAVSGINPLTDLIPFTAQDITYTSFESVSTITEGDTSAAFTYGSDNERVKMQVQDGSDTILTRWYPSGGYIKETADSVTKHFTFIGGDSYTAPVVAITQSDTTRYYYILRDYLGNITHIVNSSNNEVVSEYSFDAWGRLRNPSTWINYAPGSEPTLFAAGRGYTGHEHLPWFNIINMNGRIYDPLTGVFLSSDNYIQNPNYTQNFNRYSYCLNNPLKYTDPDGEKWKSWHFGLLDLLTGGSLSIIATSMISTGVLNSLVEGTAMYFINSFSDIDRSSNAGEIWAGLFNTDPNLSNSERIVQFISRFTLEAPQTQIGYTSSQIRNIFCEVDIEYFGGATLVNRNNPDAKDAGMTLGNYILGTNLRASTNDQIFIHEYGHTLQSRNWGPVYFVPALLSGIDMLGNWDDPWEENTRFIKHDIRWYETGANSLAADYFEKYFGIEWDDTKNPRSKDIARSLTIKK